MSSDGDTVYLGGRYLPRTDALVSVEDRGLMFGDGVYEALRCFGGRPFAMARHVARMKRSAGLIGLNVEPMIDALPRATLTLIERNDMPDAVVYWQITRGPGPRDRRFPAEPKPTVLAMVSTAAPITAAGPATTTVILHEDIRWAWRHVKALTLLPTVIAKNRALAAGAGDALFHERGVVTEATAANAFAVLDGELWTHPADEHILAGVTRGVVLELVGELGLAVREQALPVDRLGDASELMLTGTTTRVTAVTAVDGRPVGDGTPGPVARQLFAALADRVRRDCGLL